MERFPVRVGDGWRRFLLEVARGNPLRLGIFRRKNGFFRLRPSIHIREALWSRGIPAGGIPAFLRVGFDPGGDPLPSSSRWVFLLLLSLFIFPFDCGSKSPRGSLGAFAPELGLS